MQNTEPRQVRAGRSEPKTLQGLLLSALDMEDEIAHSVYRDFMQREKWPADLKDEIFEDIRKYLNILLQDTQKHRKIITHLQSRLEQSNG
jgi:hypothetical protein